MSAPSPLSLGDAADFLLDSLRIDLQPYLVLFSAGLLLLNWTALPQESLIHAYICVAFQLAACLDIYIINHDFRSIRNYIDRVPMTDDKAVNTLRWAFFARNYTLVRAFNLINLWNTLVLPAAITYIGPIDHNAPIDLATVSVVGWTLLSTLHRTFLMNLSKKPNLSKGLNYAYYKFDTFIDTKATLAKSCPALFA